MVNGDFSEFELQVGIISNTLLMHLEESNAVLQCSALYLTTNEFAFLGYTL